MYILYSFLLTIAFCLMSPLFFIRREKYAAGFSQRLGNYPEFKHDKRPVIWLHCVSVGETNAARPLVDELLEHFSDHRIVISTTTKTGQELARKIFADKADAVFYFPFDWKFSVRRALENFRPSAVLLMETEIWPRFIRQAHLSGACVAIVNGRLSEKSFNRYAYLKGFVRNVLGFVDLALMQSEKDAERVRSLGADPEKVKVTGNIKFDQGGDDGESEMTAKLRDRFGISKKHLVIVAASTHAPEEAWILKAFAKAVNDRHYSRPRLLIAPRHPERFEEVAKLISEWSGYTFARRSAPELETDKTADIILLDSIGELRAVYPLADIVFVGGSLIPHGGQSILEPAAAGRAIVTGPFTMNFDIVVKEFLTNDALVQLPEAPQDFHIVERLNEVFEDLLGDEQKRRDLGKNAAAVMKANRGATARTVAYLVPLLKAGS